MAGQGPRIQDTNQFKAYTKAKFEYENASGAGRFFSHLTTDGSTRLGRLRAAMVELEKQLSVLGYSESDISQGYDEYKKDEQEKRQKKEKEEADKKAEKRKQTEDKVGLSEDLPDDTYNKINDFMGDSNFNHNEALDRYNTVNEVYHEIPWTSRLVSHLLPNSWTHAGRIRNSLEMSKEMLDRQISGDSLLENVEGQNLSKNETIMHNYVKNYKQYANEYNQLSGFQKFCGSIFPSSWTKAGKLKIDMAINDMLMLRESNGRLNQKDLNVIRNNEYQKIKNPKINEIDEKTLNQQKQYIDNEVGKHNKIKKEEIKNSANELNTENKEEKVNSNLEFSQSEFKTDGNEKQINNNEFVTSGEKENNNQIEKPHLVDNSEFVLGETKGRNTEKSSLLQEKLQQELGGNNLNSTKENYQEQLANQNEFSLFQDNEMGKTN
mgnify:CR=1 FL=1